MKTKALPMVAAGAFLAGCLESEKACYERLSEDFLGEVEFAQNGCLESGLLDRDTCLEAGMTALESDAKIYLIWQDDDQSACDYISDGVNLRRK
ncbi:hypothetical protein [Roseovarius sp. SYSU LYC5161]|uniref:hypothetical protein n=1 Tax=Roseovarius halophilus (ex Wu et al. 2025) TaxID=3376060 RepID=UPI00399C17C5